ncbi:MAG: 16S rRNA (cytosine(967)-C(5))-methyltransferase RsmB [Gammaproteobacteria bacterium]|nr:16S rRNA (cytosine(967)-C(5))-methyltransferase RsmB [Gammaproteobacteria bacterium]
MSTPGGAAIRAAAARAVAAVAVHGRRLEDAVAAATQGGVPRPAVQSLSFGTVRWHFELAACLSILLDRPGSKQDPEVRALMLVGLFQLQHGATPEHAAVSETVEAMRALGRPRAAGLVNAVLRRFQRERQAVVAAAHASRAARHAHPEWMLDAFARDWPADWESIAAAGNAEPPMWLRVNARRLAREDYRARLAASGLAAEPCPFAPQALRLAEPVAVDTLPGFADGEVSVQDAAAQLAPFFLAAGPGMRVLDACAAPGGKACHVAELEPDLAELVAVDIDAARATRIESNLARLRLSAHVVVGDAGQPATWWDGRPFERILLDVPCSGTGVIRRHPDIKLLRRADDVARFAVQQAALLRTCWGLLAPGGRLVYASCSVLAAENAGVVGGFMAEEPAAVEVTESARLLLPGALPWRPAGPGCALRSGAADADGFYYACLEKKT